jgi:hypothetical protein
VITCELAVRAIEEADELMARRGERVGMRIGEEKERERRLWKERT